MVSEHAQWHNKVNIMKLQNNMVSFGGIKSGPIPIVLNSIELFQMITLLLT